MASATLTAYPWQREQWQRLQAAHAQGRLPHAILLHAPAGLGTAHFARLLSQALLCVDRRDAGTPCGLCTPCRQFAQGLHPDFRAVTIGEDKSQITVEQIRELAEFLSLTHGRAAGKIALIDPADAMNVNASNSLLKTLEEPPGPALFMLISEQLNRLPATIRSRCQIIKFVKPPQSEALDWLRTQGVADGEAALRLADGMPILALAVNPDEQRAYEAGVAAALRALVGGVSAASLRAAWQKLALPALARLLLGLSRDLMRAQAGVSPSLFENPPASRELQRAARLIDSEAIGLMQEKLLGLVSALAHPVNPDLARDRLLFDWLTLASNQPRRHVARR